MSINFVNNQVPQLSDMTRKSAPEVIKTGTEPVKVEAVQNKSDSGIDNQSQQFNERKVKETVDQLNEKLKMTRTRCEFSVHESVNRISIKIVNQDTNELILEVPSEKTIEMIEKAWEVAGLLVDEKR